MSQPHLQFELRVFTEPEALGNLLEKYPSVRRALFLDGVPREFIAPRYAADSSVTLLGHEGGEPLLRFGSGELSDAIAVDLVTGHVIEIVDPPGDATLFVNTSVEKFTQTVKAVIDQFPYYDTDASDEEIRTASDQVLDAVKKIDPEAAVPDRYWSTFVDDMRNGDLSTEEILAG